MAISRILGASLVSDLDRQGVDLQFSTSGNSLVYMDFVDFRLGVNETNPSEALHVNGNILVGNGNVLTSANLVYNLGSETNWWNTLYIGNIVAGSFTAGNVDGVLSTSSQPNITSLGTLTGLAIDGNLSVNVAILPFADNTGTIGTELLTWSSLHASTVNASSIYGTILTADQPNITNLGNITVDSISIGGNITITGNTNGGIINADELYEANNRVLTSNTTFTVTGDATGSGNSTNIALTLADTGVTAGIYGSADDEFADRIPKITVDSKGRITNIANVTLTQVGNVSFNDTTISANADMTVTSTGNIYLDAQGAGIVRISGSDALGLPNGDSGNRPANPETGYFRFNSDIGGIEYWDGTDWISPGIQPISSQVLTPDGVTDDFVLSDDATPESVLVMINGTLQQPYVAYTVTGNVITFSEVPLTSDVIEVRRIAAGATTVAGLALGATTVGLTAGNVNIAGNLIPAADVTYDIGSSSKQWRDLFLSGNTIHLGGATLSTDGSTLEFTPAGGSAIDLSGDTDPASISSSASNVRVTADYVNVAISSSNVASFSADGIAITGNVSATYIIGNGSQLTGLPAGYANTNVAAYLPTYTGTLGGNLAAASLTGIVSITNGGTGAATTADALNNLLPSGEQTGYVLTTGGAGTYYWATAGGGGGATVGQTLATLRQANTATAGQTVFDLVNDIDYTPGTGQLRVYIDGTRQFPSAYTETSNVSFTLSAGVSAGTEVFAEIDAFSTFENFANLTYASNIGNIQAAGLTVQNAIDTLETSKAPLASPVFTGNVSADNVSATNLTGTLLTASQPNITSIGTLSALAVTGNITAGNLNLDAGLATARLSMITTTNTGQLTFNSSQGFRLIDASTTVLAVDASGDLGVGTDNPGYRLEVTGDPSRNRVDAALTTTVGKHAEISLRNQGTHYAFWGSDNSAGSAFYANSSANACVFGTTTTNNIQFVTDFTERVRILGSTGNVGINTTNPTATLHVNGNLLVSGGNISANVNGFSIGYRELPQLTTSNVTLALSDSGKHFYTTTAGAWYQVPSNANVAFPVGTTIVVVNKSSGNLTANTQAGVTMYLAGNSTSATRTITSYGMATLIKTATNEWFINGAGVV
jgi:hypothetical protein